MFYQKRALTDRLKDLAGYFPVVVLSGARQVGKSTLLANAFPSWQIVTFDPAQDIGNARQDPDLFLDAHPAPLILDEIQYAPELVPAIKRRVDKTKKPGQYILTGSQQWAVLQTANESLAGRAVFLELEGFSLAEITNQQSTWLARYLDDPDEFVQTSTKQTKRLQLQQTLYELLFRGAMPEATRMPEALLRAYHDSYVTTYIERDVRLLSEVADRQQFGQFVQLAAALSAQEINHTQMGRELGVVYKTAQNWLRILRDTFQWIEVPAYSNNAVKRISGKPKGYFADTGLACALQRISSPLALAGHPHTGALFESAVCAEIRKQMALMPAPPRLYHWRSYGGAEVDLLLERDGVFYPIEVKLHSRPTRKDTRGITAFRQAHPQLKIAKGLVIAPTDSLLPLSDDDWAMPWDTI
jgi:predicted AAA+ superfamily ATPase